jgi:heat-inducible transcriptional repressor
MRGESELARRELEVLGALVRQFIVTGVPIGSKFLSGQLAEPLSSATIRHIMSVLEARGFLSQPHVSAGRVPTDKAYRYYVDQVMGSTRLTRETERYIEETLRAAAGALEQLMVKASRILSEVSNNVGLVLAPPLEEKLLEHIKFVTLPERRVLVVIVSKPEVVESKVVRLEEEFSQDELDRTAQFLNSEFHGWSLGTIRLEIFKRMEADKILCDRLLRNVATLCMWGALASPEESGPLFVDGTAKILDRPEFEDVGRIRVLLETFEEKARLIRILSACLQAPALGVRILIGRENSEKQMQHCTLIVAPLHYRDRAVGAVGVVGPTRMEYDRAISTVDYTAHLCSRLLSSN